MGMEVNEADKAPARIAGQRWRECKSNWRSCHERLRRIGHYERSTVLQNHWPPHLFIHADDVALWCTQLKDNSSITRDVTQHALNCIVAKASHIGQGASPSQTDGAVVPPHRRTGEQNPTPHPLWRLPALAALRATIDHRLNWRPHVKKVRPQISMAQKAVVLAVHIYQAAGVSRVTYAPL